MKRHDSVRVAIENLRANKIRSLLSMLGIVIGTGAVIVVTSLVNGTRQATMDSMMAGSKDMIRLVPTYSENANRFGKISMDDVARLSRIPFVQSVLPEVSADKEVRGSFGKAKARLVGVNLEYTKIYGYELVSGRKFSELDIEERRRVCLLRESFVRKIFGIEYPVGRRMRVEDVPLEVIGVIKETSDLSRLGKSADILTPMQTLFRILNALDIYSVEVRSEEGKLDKVKAAVAALIQSNPQQAGLLEIQDPRDYLKEVKKWAAMWMLQMILIAGVSLLVGGVGLMNVMLTTVAERTHEIGLRKTLGATAKMIQEQFLIEAATLSSVGGLIGVALGIMISYGLEIISHGKIFVAILPMSLLVSFLFSLLLGIVFGLYPASKAARLSPVEALRYE